MGRWREIGELLWEICFGIPGVGRQKRSNARHAQERAERARQEEDELAALVGQVGRTVSPLRPTGHVLIAGVKREARSAGSLLDKGVPVEVIQASRAGILVRELPPDDPRLTG